MRFRTKNRHLWCQLRVLQQLADDVEKDFTKASNIVRRFMYVDDVLAGANSIQEAQLAISELYHAFNRAGFSLRKWTANQESILEDIPNEHLLHDDFRDLNSESFPKTLGVLWNATSDEFYFVPPPVSIESTYTKREVLSQIATLFDPAGWLSPALTAVSHVERGIIHCCIKATPIPVDQLPQLALQQAHKIQRYRGAPPVQKICPVCRTI